MLPFRSFLLFTAISWIAVSTLIVRESRCHGDDLEKTIRPILKKYCQPCHGAGEKVRGQVNLAEMRTLAQVDAGFETWAAAVELVREGVMPPEGQPQPSETEKSQLQNWYQERFVDSVKSHPGFYRPRRLSAHEYRNTLRSMFGFDLSVAIVEAEQTIAEKSLVMKLLPTDPPGPSGFKNDTSGNPLTTVAWDQYSYLVDNGLEKLFSPEYRKALQKYTGPVDGELTAKQAEQLLQRWTRKAYRRPMSGGRIAAPLNALKGLEGERLQRVLQRELKRVLMSPAFLYRGLLMETKPSGIQAVDDYELAERLSYFIWADMPDETLLRLAERGALHDREALRAQVKRLLSSPKARNLAEDLGGQWFALDQIDTLSDNPPVADALKSQPLDFLNYLFTSNRPLIELVDSQVTFMNPHTAKYYPRDRGKLRRYQKQKGIEVEIVPNQRITLENAPERGGLLTMPGVLAMNKGPVLRGVWMLERVLGQHLPDPPADVGQVPNNRAGQQLTFRQRFELHRSNKTCAVCHDKIDPLGFSLQTYDGGGAYSMKAGGAPKRKKKKKNSQSEMNPATGVDTSGRLPSGETFDDFQGLRKILATSQREQVIRTIVRRMLAYALCRKLSVRDRPTVEGIVDKFKAGQGGYEDLIVEIVNSSPFRFVDVKSN